MINDTMKLKCAKSLLFRLVLTSIIILFSGCASYKIPPSELCETTSEHWLYDVIPRHRSQIAWYDAGHWIAWSLLGNDDDGIFGEGPHANYKPEEPASVAKALKWEGRNPLHNFCFYLIGSAHRTNSEYTLLEVTPCHLKVGRYSPVAKTVFPTKNSCFYFGLHGGKPFLSFRLRWTRNKSTDFYFGWRERGNFGIKCVPIATKKSPSAS